MATTDEDRPTYQGHRSRFFDYLGYAFELVADTHTSGTHKRPSWETGEDIRYDQVLWLHDWPESTRLRIPCAIREADRPEHDPRWWIADRMNEATGLDRDIYFPTTGPFHSWDDVLDALITEATAARLALASLG